MGLPAQLPGEVLGLVPGDERPPRFEVRRGVLHLDGAPRYLWSADYPYYRDDPAHWKDRLAKLKAAGIDLITSYVPWRHHAPEDPVHGGGLVDFDGTTQPNRDVKGFLALCHEMDLHALLKPGPFVHAELRYGGLPDYVDPDLNPRIEPEMLGTGALYRWIVSRDKPQANHALPAPLDPVFLEYVEDWLGTVTRELLVPFTWPRGPIVAVQLLNEGIYSDASNGIIPNYGYSRASTGLYRSFLQAKYGSLEDYNRLHGARHQGWPEVPNPVRLEEDPASRRALLAYLDRAEFAHVLYEEVILRYRHFMLDAGLDPHLPMYMNYNPNGESYVKFPASNDGWYSKVEWHPREGVQWGYTNWIGVVPHSAKAYVQYILAASRERGPNLEEDWGFSAQYDLAYASAAPSYYQSMLYLANGATGLNVYTGVGTKAWRKDANLKLEDIPWERGADDDTEYPGHAPISAEGKRRHKYWTVAQLGAYLQAEGASLATSPRAASLAWAVYTPYAWAGAWAPRGIRDHKPFHNAGLRACPHVTYHGLEALIETSLTTGIDWRQLDLREASPEEVARWPLLVLAAYDFMSPEAQRKLVQHVREGGHLLVTGLLPRWNEALEKDAMPLREELFPHDEEEFVRLRRPMAVQLAGGPTGKAVTWAVRVRPPPGAEPVATIHDDVVGYRVRVGAGTATYLGYHPWYATLSGDDVALVEANRGIAAWAAQAAGLRAAWAKAVDHEGVDVWQYTAPDDVQHLVVVSRTPQTEEVEVRWTRSSGEPDRLRLVVLPRVAHAITLKEGQVRSLLLKCINDHEGVRAPPRLVAAGRRWGTEHPSDLCVAAMPGGVLEVRVANVEGGRTEVALGVPPEAVERISNGRGFVPMRTGQDGGLRFEAGDVADHGEYRVQLRKGDHPWWVAGRSAPLRHQP
jgi:beta-galactosidase